jgi:hypothetical protein
MGLNITQTIQEFKRARRELFFFNIFFRMWEANHGTCSAVAIIEKYTANGFTKTRNDLRYYFKAKRTVQPIQKQTKRGCFTKPERFP